MPGNDRTGFQMMAPPHTIQQQQTEIRRGRRYRRPSSLRDFLLDDLKLYVAPVTAVVNEFLRQIRR
jgi:hypothetical protein